MSDYKPKPHYSYGTLTWRPEHLAWLEAGAAIERAQKTSKAHVFLQAAFKKEKQ